MDLIYVPEFPDSILAARDVTETGSEVSGPVRCTVSLFSPWRGEARIGAERIRRSAW